MSNPSDHPAYVGLLENGLLEKRVRELNTQLQACNVCPWNCGVDRLAEEVGFCHTGRYARVSSYGPHFGEERVLTGWRGSGTIFFSRCNLQCQFCQNHDISQRDAGQEVSPAELAQIMLELQDLGCHNVNLVSPSHVVPQIISALAVAASVGLRLPLVYNTGGYDSILTLRRLDGIVDIYMPDMKYAREDIARRYSKVPNYPLLNQAAVREMHRQVGDLKTDASGVATRGLLVRHLVLPDNLAGTQEIVEFLARQISTDTYLNLMDQYRPQYKAHTFPELQRRITPEEWRLALQSARQAGLSRLDKI